MTVDEVVEKFNQSPTYVRKGAGFLASRFNCNRDIIYAAKEAYKKEEVTSPERGKILLFDLEISPIISYTWGTRKQFIHPEQVIQEPFLMTYAAKWLEKGDIISGTVKEEEDYDDFNIVSEMWSLLDEADVVVAHNLNRFDKKKINARFLKHGMTPPSPYKCVDTLTISKVNFGTIYHKLDYLSKYIGSDGKMEHEGFELWSKCLKGDSEAWDKMLSYNEKDVLELEKVYLALRPWDSRHPSMSVFKEDSDCVCTKCGSSNLEYKKDTFTNTRIFKLYQCSDCGGWSRSRTSENKSKALMTQ